MVSTVDWQEQTLRRLYDVLGFADFKDDSSKQRSAFIGASDAFGALANECTKHDADQKLCPHCTCACVFAAMGVVAVLAKQQCGLSGQQVDELGYRLFRALLNYLNSVKHDSPV